MDSNENEISLDSFRENTMDVDGVELNPEVPSTSHDSDDVINFTVEQPITTRFDINDAVQAPIALEASENKRSPKKRRISDDNTLEDDGKTCPICLDNWTNVGPHRICVLKCGHLFGSSCIKKWFNIQKCKNCPTCKHKAVKGDIRYVYARKLIAVDTSELENVKRQLNDVTQDKNRIQIDLTKALCRENSLLQEIDTLKKQQQFLEYSLTIKRLSNSESSSDSTAVESTHLYKEKSLEICKNSGCRVLDCCAKSNLIAVSMKSPNPLFPGFGIRKIDTVLYKPTAFIPLHTKPIRDICFHPENPWILSVSFDKVVKVIDTNSNRSICLNTCDDPLWSCCWDVNDTNYMYVGKQQGSALKFDVRQMTDAVCKLSIPGDMSPVVSIESLPASISDTVSNGGVALCKLNSLWVFENISEQYTSHLLPVEGPFTSMTRHGTRELLISTRSNSRYPYSRHHFCSIETGTSDSLTCSTIHCFTGSSTQKFMSRSCIVSRGADHFVVAHQESSKSVFLWSINTGEKYSSFPARDPVLDLCGFSCNNNTFVASLTEQKIDFFSFS